MFTPDEIESIPLAIEKLFKDLQLRVMSDVVRRLVNVQDISASADYQMSRLYELGKSKEEIQRLVQETLDKSNEEIDSIFTDIIQSGYARDNKLYTAVGRDFIPYKENKPLQQLVKAMQKQTKNDCRNITQSMGFAVKQPDGKLTFKPIAQYYQDTLDKTVVDITSGGFDYNTVLNRTVSEMTNSGLRTVDYASGYSNRTNVAARRAIMTGVRQVTAKISEDNAEKLETEYFEVSWHRGARPSHQEFQGKVYSREELVSVCGLGTVEGLGGANCYHSYDPFVMGISERKYTDEWLDEQNAKENTPVEYNGKEYTVYEATQRQRSLETTMRAQREKIRLLEEGNADEDSIIAAKARYFKTSDEYVRFSKAMDLPQQRERVFIDGKGRISNKSVAKSAESGIIDRKKTTVDANDISIIANSSPTIQDTKEFVDLLNNNSNDNIKRAYKYYSAQLNSVKYNLSRGCYRSNLKEISYGYPDKKELSDGRSKFSTLSHEYGHFIDDVGVFKNLNFREIDAIKQSVKLSNNLIKNKASVSDEFLKALRKDKNALSANIFDSTFRDDLFSSSASAGVQDAICGMFGTKRTKMIWQHKDSYYDRRYSSFKQLKIEKDIQKVYISLGYDVSNQAKVKSIVRDYETASEMWANIMSAETCGGLELEYVKKYLPNSYSSFLDIMKELK